MRIYVSSKYLVGEAGVTETPRVIGQSEERGDESAVCELSINAETSGQRQISAISKTTADKISK